MHGVVTHVIDQDGRLLDQVLLDLYRQEPKISRRKGFRHLQSGGTDAILP